MEKEKELKDGRYVEEIDRFTRISYYKEGVLHNENGPAIEWSNGKNYWYLNGSQCSEDQVKHFLVKKELNEKLQLNLQPTPKTKGKKI